MHVDQAFFTQALTATIGLIVAVALSFRGTFEAEAPAVSRAMLASFMCIMLSPVLICLAAIAFSPMPERVNAALAGLTSFAIFCLLLFGVIIVLERHDEVFESATPQDDQPGR